MAALDGILDSMGPSGAELLALQTGEVPLLHTGEGTRPVHSKPLEESQVISYVRELAGPRDRKDLEGRKPAAFQYRTFLVEIDFPPEGAKAEIRPMEPGGAARAGRRGEGSLRQQRNRRALSQDDRRRGFRPSPDDGGEAAAAA